MIVTDSDYLKQLEIIRKIRDTITTKDDINLPQICVIGDQSSGKSSFLSRLTGVRFPTAAKMCTKAATVVTCNRDESLQTPKYEIEDWEKRGSYNEVDCTEEAINSTQDKLLSGEGNKDENRIVSDRSIKLRVSGPDVIDIIIVDLPGIQHAGPMKDAINTLIEENIKKPETLNLLVSEAKQDAELTKAIEIAAKYDPENERTIRVLSKFDNFDTNETRGRAIQMVKDGVEGLHDGKPPFLNLGPHAVISIDTDGKLRSDKDGDSDEMEQLIKQYGLVTLKERLQPMFAGLIKKNLPLLKEQVSQRLFEMQIKLEGVGENPLSPLEMVFKCHACLRQNFDHLRKELTRKSFLPMKEQIYEVKGKITFEFATSDFKLDSFECILFQGKPEFDAVAKRILILWEPIVNLYLKSSKEVVLESLQHFLRIESSTKFCAPLIMAIQAEYQEHMQALVLPMFQDACMTCLHEEGFFGTTNHYFDAKFFADEICPQKLIDVFQTKVGAVLTDSAKSPRCPQNSHYRQVNQAHLVNCLKEAKEEVATAAVHTDLMENQKQRLFSAVKAHFDVEKKTLVDNMLKQTKDILINGYVEWIEHDLLRSQKIIDAAEEDEAIKVLRTELRGGVQRLEECMHLLRDVSLPPKETAA